MIEKTKYSLSDLKKIVEDLYRCNTSNTCDNCQFIYEDRCSYKLRERAAEAIEMLMPKPTFLDVFKDAFPKSKPITEDNLASILACNVFPQIKCGNHKCSSNCRQCWDRTYFDSE